MGDGLRHPHADQLAPRARADRARYQSPSTLLKNMRNCRRPDNSTSVMFTRVVWIAATLLLTPARLEPSQGLIPSEVRYSNLPGLGRGFEGLLRLSDPETISFYFNGNTLRIRSSEISIVAFEKSERLLTLQFASAASPSTLCLKLKGSDATEDQDVRTAILRIASALPR